MPTPTYTPLSTITLTSSAFSVTFSGIPNTYRDLIVVFDGFRDGNNNVGLRLNGDTGSNYSNVTAGGTINAPGVSSSASTIAYAIAYQDALDASKTTARFQIFDYSQTDKHKTILTRGNQAATNTAMVASRWASTSAVTSVTILAPNNSFLTGSTFSLYGIVS